MAILLAGRRTAAVAVMTTLRMATWAQVLGAETPVGSAEGDAKGGVGEEPEAEEVVGGDGDAALTPVGSRDTQNDVNAEALVLVGATNPPTESDTPEPKGEVEREPIIGVDNAIGKMEEETPATTLPTEPLPKTTETAVIVEVTAKPSLRTEDPAVISNAVTNDAADTRPPGYLDQGINPLVLVALMAICCIFLFLWGRKRRSNTSSSSDTSAASSSKRPKVQYTQVPDEQPFSHSQDDDDEYCDDYEEDTFANDRDNWDDWEGNTTQMQEPQLNPFASAPAAPRPTTPRQSNSSSSPFQPLPPPPRQQHHAQPQEIATAEETHAPPVSSRGAATDVEKESESVDDLFSQFGMVPTFKKSAVVLPPPTASTPASQSATATAMPSAAEASALFAAEMDDELTAVAAADEWGEDDEWVKGI